MRHRISGRKLGRTPAHRTALFRNMAKALLVYGRITTTEAKAKELRVTVEPLITLGRVDDLHSRREAYRCLGCHKLVKRLFDQIAPAFAGEKGGFTRIVKLSQPRRGDNAAMAVIELTRGAPSLDGSKDAGAEKTAAPQKTSGGKSARQSKTDSAAKAARPKALKTAAPRAPKAAPKSAAPQKRKIGGE